MISRTRASLGVIGAVVVAASVIAVPSATATPPLTWTTCPYPDSPAELQCASLRVPVDYANPRGATATVTVNRLRATGPRVGTLFFDPGGPGGSGTEAVYAAALGRPLFTEATRSRFDLIGIDPRGVGLSSPIQCDPAILNERVSLFPTDDAGFRRLVAHNQALGRSCRERTGLLFDHVDTISAARDLDAVRRAMGLSKIDYLGLSYGSQLGATYAELFPDRFRTMALDAAVDHAQPLVGLFTDESRAYEDSLNRFTDWCGTACPDFDALVAAADRTPIPAPGCADGSCRPTVTGEDIRLTTQGLLLFPVPNRLGPVGRDHLAQALRDAAAGDATAFALPLATGPADAGASAMAVECLDWPTPIRTLTDLNRLRALGKTIAPHTGGASQSWTILTGCVGWPAPPTNPPAPPRMRPTPKILITNATHDPSTAYPWAVRLRRQLPDSILATRDGDGHTSYLASGESHTRDAIDTYLATGKTPPDGTVFTD